MFLKNMGGVFLFVLVIFFTVLPGSAQLVSEGGGFTYQGRLSQSNQPAEGVFGMRFSLWDDPNSVEVEHRIGLTQTVPSVLVMRGVFSVVLNQQKQFGAKGFNGESRWLEIGVKGAADPNYIMLSPRQGLTAAPYALTALSPGIRRVQRATGLGPNESVVGLSLSRKLTFVKTRNDTAVRILYSDVFRIQNDTYKCSGRWSIYINGEPAPGGGIYKDVYIEPGGHKIHHPGVIVGYVDDLPAGTYTIQVYVSTTPGENSGDFWTGWKSSRWVLEAEEVVY